MSRLAAILCLLGASLWGGCHCPCPGDCVPVSLEGAYDFLRFYGRCYHEYPYSCPCCPYYSGVAGHHQVYSEYEVRPQKAPKPAAYDAEPLPEAEDEGPPSPEPELE